MLILAVVVNFGTSKVLVVPVGLFFVVAVISQVNVEVGKIRSDALLRLARKTTGVADTSLACVRKCGLSHLIGLVAFIVSDKGIRVDVGLCLLLFLLLASKVGIKANSSLVFQACTDSRHIPSRITIGVVLSVLPIHLVEVCTSSVRIGRVKDVLLSGKVVLRRSDLLHLSA